MMDSVIIKEVQTVCQKLHESVLTFLMIIIRGGVSIFKNKKNNKYSQKVSTNIALHHPLNILLMFFEVPLVLATYIFIYLYTRREKERETDKFDHRRSEMINVMLNTSSQLFVLFRWFVITE